MITPSAPVGARRFAATLRRAGANARGLINPL